MSIRNRLIFLFVSIVAVILVATSASVYFFSATNRKEEFYKRLENNARITAKLLIEVDEITPDVLRRIEKDNPTSLPEEEIKIYDYLDSVLYTSDKEEFIGVEASLLDRIRLDSEIRFTRGPFECLGFLYSDRYGHFVIIVGAVDVYGNQKLSNLRTILFSVFGIAIFIIFISGYFYVSKALQPVAKVIKDVDDISATSLDRRLDEGGGKDEFSKLAHTFNLMLERLEQSFLSQKAFIANASHEIRNPLTAILGQIDVSLLTDRSQLEYKKVLESVREDINNLKIVSNGLLMLAQANAERVEKGFTILRLDQLLWDAKAELVRMHPEFNIIIEMDSDLDDEAKLRIKGDEQLLKGALLNILDNGCKYSADHTIHAHISFLDKRTVINFRDKGIGISQEEVPFLFEPFYRGRNAQGYKGHGIGLSLAYRIIKSHRGDIHVETALNLGTRVTVYLPSPVADS